MPGSSTALAAGPDHHSHVTDRDLVVRGLADGLDPSSAAIEEDPKSVLADISKAPANN